MHSYGINDELHALRTRVRTFVDDHVIPNEGAILEEDLQGRRDTLNRLRGAAADAGLWTPHLPVEFGGLGLGIMGMCALFREMGRSPLGAKVFNCDAPDQGNMDLLLNEASEPIKERYLKPLAAAEITSGFAMTEPAPGAGADPTNLRTTATREGDDWVINGRKWFTTGGGASSFLIVMARTSDDRKTGATLFVIDRNAPGLEHVRDVPVMALDILDHKEGEFLFDEVRVGDEAVLGGIGQGFWLAQRRLVPARLTHCMRWLGWADRIVDMCRPYITTRKSFGKELSRHQAVQHMLARAATGIHAGNLMTLHCAWLMEQGDPMGARAYSSMAKNYVANVLCQTLDDAIQMHGAAGYSTEYPFQEWYRAARAARLADGPDEVHKMVIAREVILGRVDLLV